MTGRRTSDRGHAGSRKTTGAALSGHRRTPRLTGKVCVRCGRILNETERLLGELAPPAVCADCTSRELGLVEAALEAWTWRRRARFARLVNRAARNVAARG